ncbi:MAG: ABC transporter ATP-binding protein, partial [Clostridia bacterium]|nr:ABC transporter ATP-binding protein [Clostridia bacterium]
MKSKSFGWIVANTRFALLPVVALCLLGVAMSYCGMYFAFASKSVMDIATGASSDSLLNAVLCLCVLIVLQIVIHIVYSVVEIKINCTLTNRLQNNLFSKILTRDYLSVTNYHSGELVNRLSNDVTVISGSVMTLLPTLCMLVAKVVFSFGALYVLDRNFALVCIVILPFVTIAGRIYGKRMKSLHKQCSTAKGNILSYMQEAIRNLLVIKAFVKENMSAAQLGKLQDASMRLNIKRGIISLLANLMFFAVMTFGYYCALVWCAYKISVGIMTVGTLTAILQLFDQLQTPFADFSGIVPSYYQMLASAERIMELENQTADLPLNRHKCSDVQYIKLDNVS